ncbi:biofilm development regulator YmgB/AriR family protein [Pantoea tagorei]|uniref:biofilm development regulator YmgB/AriR family protein n=1 Tax=unclassified Pantoea TaxID=2630326 RepID=UPI001EF5213D|nr:MULTISPECIES: biofilm development regulator YmgB/AriR family protein [unclassified Pantoea]MCG7366285.1 biofilm development regulator YmgB/AriR family protein [Pantoea sp. ACRSH]MCG7396851.1 biofilm development regulator YmgB/AriR family protein [Pantoea sp. ACRSC]
MLNTVWRNVVLIHSVGIRMHDNSTSTLMRSLKDKQPEEADIKAFIIGSIVYELMNSERMINRKAICCKLLRRLECCESPEEERLYHQLIKLLFGGNRRMRSGD